MTRAKKYFKNLFTPQLVKFLVVGASGTIIDYLLLILLKSFNWQTLIANTLSFSAGLVNNYYWNSHWTFNERSRKSSLKQFSQFTMISLVGLGLNTAIVLVLEIPMGEILGMPEVGYIPAKACATIIVLFWNYLANRHWTFNPSKKNPAIKGD
jgi:putative flippase GtrA